MMKSRFFWCWCWCSLLWFSGLASAQPELSTNLSPRAAERSSVTAESLFDRGNESFRRGHYAEAILAYRRALKRSGGDQRTRFNLQEAEQRLGLRSVGETPLDGVLDAMRRPLDHPGLIWLCLLVQTLAFLVIVGRRGRWLRVLALVVGGITFWCLVQGLRQAGEQDRQEAVVMVSGAGLRLEPHQHESLTRALPVGALVTVKNQSENWVLVTSGGHLGYLPRAEIGLVD